MEQALKKANFILKAKTAYKICLVIFFTALPFQGIWANQEKEHTLLMNTLLQGIEANFKGDYDRAWEIFAKIDQLDPNHPSREFYQTLVLFWKNNTDSNNPRFDQQITELLESSIRKSEAILEKNPASVEALHYLGLAYTYLGRLDAHRDRMYAGGVKGETGREFLEEAMTICDEFIQDSHNRSPSFKSTCEELYFPFGAYTYFAGRLPKFLKFLNFLWFIPSGSTEEGLASLERSYKNSRLHQLGTQILLINIYTNFEKEHLPKALEMSKSIQERFPNNSYLDLIHAQILLESGQPENAIKHADHILSKTKNGTPNYGPIVAFQSQLFKAEALIIKKQFDRALQLLNPLSTNPNYQKNTHTARIYLLFGMAEDALGNRQEALKMYDKTLDQDALHLDRMAKSKAQHYKDIPFEVPEQK